MEIKVAEPSFEARREAEMLAIWETKLKAEVEKAQDRYTATLRSKANMGADAVMLDDVSDIDEDQIARYLFTGFGNYRADFAQCQRAIARWFLLCGIWQGFEEEYTQEQSANLAAKCVVAWRFAVLSIMDYSLIEGSPYRFESEREVENYTSRLRADAEV